MGCDHLDAVTLGQVTIQTVTVVAFVADTSDDAFAKVVDRLLASPRFGERWGRHWLDLARYAESTGNANMMYPQAWRYRDWVVAALNKDYAGKEIRVSGVIEQPKGGVCERQAPARFEIEVGVHRIPFPRV